MTSSPDADLGRDVTELIDRTGEAADAWMRGDMDRYLDLIHHAPGFTLTAPNGGSPVQFADRRSEFQGWQSPFADGAATLEITAVHAWGDTAILVMVERQHGRIADCRTGTCPCGSPRSIAGPPPAGSWCTGTPTPSSVRCRWRP